MKDSIQQDRVSLLLSIDANHLFDKIKSRTSDCVHLFSLHRTRDHYNTLFKNKFESTPVSELKHLSDEMILAFTDFYFQIDELKWYLFYTEDMPTQIEDHLSYSISLLEHKLIEINTLVECNRHN
jgi:hypothetical protein